MTDKELDKAFLQLVESGEFDRILRHLRSRWDRVPREVVLEALQDASEEVVKRQQAGGTITNLAGLLTTIARRRLGAIWEEMQREREAREVLVARAGHPGVWGHDEDYAAKIERAAAYIRTLAARIDSENHRRTVLTIIDAAAEGIQLENKDLGEILGCIPNTAGMWKLRGFQRVRVLLETEGVMSWEDIIEMIPLPEDDETDEDNESEDEEDDDA